MIKRTSEEMYVGACDKCGFVVELYLIEEEKNGKKYLSSYCEICYDYILRKEGIGILEMLNVKDWEEITKEGYEKLDEIYKRKLEERQSMENL